jgi:hypothetical protein
MLNEKQKEILTEFKKQHYYLNDTELERYLNDFAESILNANTVSFPEPSERQKCIYTISPDFLMKIGKEIFASGGFAIPDNQIEYVLLAYQKYMNEGKL